MSTGAAPGCFNYNVQEQIMYDTNVLMKGTHILVLTQDTHLYIVEECSSCGVLFKILKAENTVPIIRYLDSNIWNIWTSIAFTITSIPTCHDILMSGVLE